MDTLTLIISLALVGVTLALVLWPLWQQNRSHLAGGTISTGDTLEELETRYQAVLTTIKDLMFDYEMGKVTPEDYDTLLTKSKFEAADIRRQIDVLNRQDQTELDAALDTEIETLVSQVKSSQPNGNQALLAAVDAEIESLKHIRADGDGAPCPHCDTTAQPGDVFCSNCGQALDTVQADPNRCPQCAAPIEPDDAFCAKCGAALESKLATRNPQTVDVE